MALYRVTIHTYVSAELEVEVPDEVTDHGDITDLALERPEYPTLCTQCAGENRDYYLQMDDKWDVTLDPHGAPSVDRIDR